MANVLPREKQILVLRMLVEGNSLRSVVRLTGVHRTTIMKLMVAIRRAVPGVSRPHAARP